MRQLPLPDEEQILLRGIAGRVAALAAAVETEAHLGEIRRLRAATTAAFSQMKNDLGALRRDTATLSGRTGR